MRLRIPLAILALAAIVLLTGCSKELYKYISYTETITDADDSTPNGVIQTAIEAAMDEDMEAGWDTFRDLLHSNQDGRASLMSWKQNNFQAFRRKVHLYLEDDATSVYEKAYEEEMPRDRLKIFVMNEMSDVPTPCQVRKDAEAGGAWKIEMCSL